MSESLLRSIQEKRARSRESVRTEVIVSFLFPEETFTAQRLAGSAVDIGSKGVRIRSESITRTMYFDLMRVRRHAKVEFLRNGVKIGETHGTVEWIDFKDGAPPTTEVGVSFTKEEERLSSEVVRLSGFEAT